MKKSVLYISLAFVALSCEKAFLDDNPDNDPRSNFEILWKTVDEKYSFFITKNINWDSVYTFYSPMVTSETTDQELFDVFDEMLFDLRDGHVNLISPFDISRNWEWYLNFPDNYDEQVVERNYLGPDHRIAGGIKYTIIDSIGYIYYGSFSAGFTTQNLDEVFTYLEDTKGVIIDVRNNGGGSLNNAYALAQRFIPEQKHVLTTFEKTGPGHGDFGNGLGVSLSSVSRPNYTGPVALLTNRRCYSATNTFTAILSNFDHVTQIGDRTGGGGGIPVDNELPNGWRYRFSATLTTLPNGFDIELGIPPDVVANNTPDREAQGIDDIIERALTLLD